MQRYTFRLVSWLLLNYVLIAGSVASLLVPGMADAKWFSTVHMVALGAFLFALAWRLRADRSGNIPIGELYEEVKRGRSLMHEQPLATATLVTYFVASLLR